MGEIEGIEWELEAEDPSWGDDYPVWMLCKGLDFMHAGCGPCPVDPTLYKPYLNKAPAEEEAKVDCLGARAYVADGHRRQAMDVYRPKDFGGPVPALLFFHGGGWAKGSRGSNVLWGHSAVGVRLAARGQMTTCMCEYRFSSLSWGLQLLLSSLFAFFGLLFSMVVYEAWDVLLGTASLIPSLHWMIVQLIWTLVVFLAVNMVFLALESFPRGLLYHAAVEDVGRAVQYVREHAQELHVDPEHIFVMGHSAGGHLVMQWALTASTEDLRGVEGVIGVGGVYDIPRLMLRNIFVGIGMGVRAFGLRPSDHHTASPVHMARQGLEHYAHRRYLLVNAEYDFWLPLDARDLAAVLRLHGATVHRLRVLGERHRSVLFQTRTLDAISLFVHNRISPPSPP